MWCQFITSLHFNKFSKRRHPLVRLRLSSKVYIYNSFLMLIITDPVNPPPTANSSVPLTSQHLIKNSPTTKMFLIQNDWFSHSNISPPQGLDIKLWQVWGSCSDDDWSKNVIQLRWQKWGSCSDDDWSKFPVPPKHHTTVVASVRYM